MPGRRLWHVVVCYLSLHNASTLDIVVAEIGHRYRDADILVARNFNIDLEFTYGNKHNKAITASVEMEGLEYMEHNFLPHNLLWMFDVCT